LLEELFETFNTSINLDVRDDISQRGGICMVHDGAPDANDDSSYMKRAMPTFCKLNLNSS